MKDKKGELNEQIISYSKQNNLLSSVIELKDSKIKFVSTKTTQPLSLKYVETCLTNIIKDGESIKKIMTYIKNNREVKENIEIKRVFSNGKE